MSRRLKGQGAPPALQLLLTLTSCTCSPRSPGAPPALPAPPHLLPCCPLSLGCPLSLSCPSGPFRTPHFSPAPVLTPLFPGLSSPPWTCQVPPRPPGSSPLEALCPLGPIPVEVLPLLSTLLCPSTHALLWPLAASSFWVTCPLPSSHSWSSGSMLWSARCILGAVGSALCCPPWTQSTATP